MSVCSLQDKVKEIYRCVVDKKTKTEYKDVLGLSTYVVM